LGAEPDFFFVLPKKKIAFASKGAWRIPFWHPNNRKYSPFEKKILLQLPFHMKIQ
jgi:hypothetical protein